MVMGIKPLLKGALFVCRNKSVCIKKGEPKLPFSILSKINDYAFASDLAKA